MPRGEVINNESEKDTLIVERVDAAFLLAARKVIQVALQTGTPIVVWEEGHVKEISAERAEAMRLATKIEEVRA